MKGLINKLRLAGLNDLMVLYVFILLVIPMGMFQVTSVYTFKTPEYIDYGYQLLNEAVSVLYLPVVCYAIYVLVACPHKYVLKSFVFLIVIVLLQGVRALSDPFIIDNSQYELFFVVFAAISIIAVLFARLRTAEQMAAFFYLFVIAHALGVAFYALMHYESRINAQNLDYGSSGLIFGLFCIYVWGVKEKITLASIIFPLIPLFLTGSRSHLIVTILLLLVIIISKIELRSLFSGKVSKHGMMIIGGAILLATLLPFAMQNINLSLLSESMISRATSVQSIEDLQSDKSAVGRLNSIYAGVKVLVENPMGVTFSFIDLQRNMNMKNYPTFPHQNLLASYLVLGPIFLIILIYFFRTLFQLKRNKSTYRYIYYYVLIYSFVAGGCPHQVKVVFIYMFVLLLGAKIASDTSSRSVTSSWRSV